MEVLFLVLGLVLLILGGEFALRGAIGLARSLNISTAVIGLTVMGFGTSAPELVVTVQAVLSGGSDIAIGNAIGSNIANTLLILGAGAVIRPLSCDPRAVRRDGTIMMLATFLLCALGLTGGIVAWQGATMLGLLATFLWWSYLQDKRYHDAAAVLHEDSAAETSGIPKSKVAVVSYIVAGFAGLAIGASLLVDAAVALAESAGISQSVIGLTLVALGTSLPELAATMVAAYRRHTDIAIANVLGSNIFNILGVLGAGAAIGPLQFADQIISVDQWVMLSAAIVLLPIMITGWHISRKEGGMLLAAYVVYMGSLTIRL